MLHHKGKYRLELPCNSQKIKGLLGLTQSYTRYSFPSVRPILCHTTRSQKNNMLFSYGIRGVTHSFYIPCFTRSSFHSVSEKEYYDMYFIDEETLHSRGTMTCQPKNSRTVNKLLCKHTASIRDHQLRH